MNMMLARLPAADYGRNRDRCERAVAAYDGMHFKVVFFMVYKP
jgi:hypothetical protein